MLLYSVDMKVSETFQSTGGSNLNIFYSSNSKSVKNFNALLVTSGRSIFSKIGSNRANGNLAIVFFEVIVWHPPFSFFLVIWP